LSTLVDDVGSFPLPAHVSRETFDKAYVKARQAIIDGRDLAKDEFLLKNFRDVVVDSFRAKLASGLDVVNYPQHYDMHKQITDSITQAMEQGTYVVDEKQAVIPEVQVINAEAKRLSEEIGKRIPLRVCITGPLELYLKVLGTVAYSDVLLMFAETVNRFARNSVLDNKYVRTEVVSLDEPSLGFREPLADWDVLSDVLEKAFGFACPAKQIHLHSPLKTVDVLSVRNLDVVSFEFGASPKNIESLSKGMLDRADKRVRVGIARTDIDSIRAELYDKGITSPSTEEIVETEETIRRRFKTATSKYGDRLAFTGPDCGLGGWPTQQAAQLLLKRTVSAVKKAQS